MRVLLAVAAAQLVAAAVDIDSAHRSSTIIVPDSYIIQFQKDSGHLKRGFVSPHEEFYHDLRARGATWQTTKEFTDPIFTGTVIKFGSHYDINKLAQVQAASLEGSGSIERIYLNYLREIPEGGGAATAVGPGAGINPGAPDNYPPHKMTGVNGLHAKGIFGKGITIGIIDTGIDYTHPALGGKFGPGNKVAGGYDFVGDAYTGTGAGNVTQPDDDPLDECNGHGTHVAGIIGANPGNPYNISGVAYEATLNAYRVFGCTGSVSDEVIIAALLRAHNDGCDILTLSLGGAAGWTESASAVVASGIADAGKIVTIAAGNDRQYGLWHPSSPGNGLNVISVGSVDNTIVNIQNATVSTGRQIPYYSFLPLNITNGRPIYATTSNTNATDDACNPLPASTPDLSQYIVLIRRGTCAFTHKMANAAEHGAKSFLIYNNVEEPLSGITVGNYTAALISQQDGIYLIKEAIPANATMKFGNQPYALEATTGGLMSDFSTYGPTNDMFSKPAISAPGGNILSTYPQKMGSYAVESGTSMATPYTAGVGALFFQVRGKTADNAKAFRGILQNTASFIRNSKQEGSPYDAASRQGAGLIQAYNACYGTGSMSPAEILLNDRADFVGQHTVTISNTGTKAYTYRLSHGSAGIAPTIEWIENLFGPVAFVNPPVPVSTAASVTITPTEVTIQPDSTAQITLSFAFPNQTDPKTFPVYTGFIQAMSPDGGSMMHSTYQGVAAALKDTKVIDNTDTYFGEQLPLVTDKNGDPINGTTTHSMQGNDVEVDQWL
ncbi:hypothetical protein FRC12_008567 [Ceratobasidium sp. 428]|nr:hypothetical protein FRC12_008567 [Ceratobasidium sp. 428]